MNIQIQVLSVTTETKLTQKGSYQLLEVAYKDLSNDGKVSSKKLMSFANKRVFDTLAIAKPATVFDISMAKNDKGYWDWLEAKRAEVTASATAQVATTTGVNRAAGATAPAKGGWETPEERAKKQVYIIRQSSLSTAVAALKTEKVQLNAKEVIDLAKQFEDYVFSTGDVQAVVSQDVGSIEDITEDLPF